MWLVCRAKLLHVPLVASPPTSVFISIQSKRTEGDRKKPALPSGRKLVSPHCVPPLEHMGLARLTCELQRSQKELRVPWEKRLPGNL